MARHSGTNRKHPTDESFRELVDKRWSILGQNIVGGIVGSNSENSPTSRQMVERLVILRDIRLAKLGHGLPH